MLQGLHRVPSPNTQSAVTEESKQRPSRIAEPAALPAWERLFEIGSAADVLFRAGLLAQSYRVALQQLTEIAQCAGEGDRHRLQGQPGPAGSARDQRAASVLAELQALPVPAHDGEFTAQHAAALREALAAGATWLRATENRAAQARLRLRRGVVAAICLVLLTGGALVALYPRSLQVNVSSRYATEFEGTNVVDGSVASEWLLPDGQLGWIELRFRSPRMLHNIRIRNAVNRHYHDRATRTFRLEVFRGDQRLSLLHGEYPGIGVGDPTLAFPIAAASADRILVTIESFHGLGGGIAEIELD